VVGITPGEVGGWGGGRRSDVKRKKRAQDLVMSGDKGGRSKKEKERGERKEMRLGEWLLS